MKINIKALSINKAFKGRRFKTQDYKDYEQEAFYLLSNDVIIPDGNLELYLEVGLSSKLADLDNIAKLWIDILQKRFCFNDRRIYKLLMIKKIVKKGDEYITFNFKEYVENK